MTDKEEVVGVHSPELEFEKNIDSMNGAIQRYGIAHPAVADKMVENNTTTTIKLNKTQRRYISDRFDCRWPNFSSKLLRLQEKGYQHHIE